jgi:hypothetical protein
LRIWDTASNKLLDPRLGPEYPLRRLGFLDDLHVVKALGSFDFFHHGIMKVSADVSLQFPYIFAVATSRTFRSSHHLAELIIRLRNSGISISIRYN